MSGSTYLVETYAMKMLYKEKMKTLEKEEATTHEIICRDQSKESPSSGGWFTKMFKKVHPITTPSSDSATKSRTF
ncbi:hypothetical protein MTR67_020469 [Solanum verrucosum]|uniref:Uncharacterized protein n=1 Tax=Solanum verrucosum TaxID=315347 RepID=A0AAF0TPG9_SOLVR|nr:hypothetical protein MTR67_020469 [Solanum verrucosum]